jgi:hypothetical protein
MTIQMLVTVDKFTGSVTFRILFSYSTYFAILIF